MDDIPAKVSLGVIQRRCLNYVWLHQWYSPRCCRPLTSRSAFSRGAVCLLPMTILAAYIPQMEPPHLRPTLTPSGAFEYYYPLPCSFLSTFEGAKLASCSSIKAICIHSKEIVATRGVLRRVCCLRFLSMASKRKVRILESTKGNAFVQDQVKNSQ